MALTPAAIGLGLRAAQYAYGKYQQRRSMAPMPKYSNLRYRQRWQKKKGKKNNLRLGQIHCKQYQTSYHLETSPIANSIHSQKLTTISQGDLYDERQSNNILAKHAVLKINFDNQHTEARIFRMAILTLRGSTATADISGWTDLTINSSFTKQAPQGVAASSSDRYNEDEYQVLWSRTVVVPEKDTSLATFNKNYFIKLNKIVKYLYNSTNERMHPLYFVMYATEAGNNPINAGNTAFSYSLFLTYADVDRM